MTSEDFPKPRSDSVLKTLPEERQDEVAEFAHGHSLKETVQWLSDAGVKTSISALGAFLTWHRLQQTLLRNDTAVKTLVAELGKACPELSTERLHHIGHIFFSSLALQRQDHKAWYMAEQIALRTARLKLDTRKYNDELKTQRETRAAALPADPTLAGLTSEVRSKIEKDNNIL